MENIHWKTAHIAYTQPNNNFYRSIIFVIRYVSSSIESRVYTFLYGNEIFNIISTPKITVNIQRIHKILKKKKKNVEQMK